MGIVRPARKCIRFSMGNQSEIPMSGIWTFIVAELGWRECTAKSNQEWSHSLHSNSFNSKSETCRLQNQPSNLGRRLLHELLPAMLCMVALFVMIVSTVVRLTISNHARIYLVMFLTSHSKQMYRMFSPDPCHFSICFAVTVSFTGHSLAVPQCLPTHGA